MPTLQSDVCAACTRGDHATCDAHELGFCMCWRRWHEPTDSDSVETTKPRRRK